MGCHNTQRAGNARKPHEIRSRKGLVLPPGSPVCWASPGRAWAAQGPLRIRRQPWQSRCPGFRDFSRAAPGWTARVAALRRDRTIAEISVFSRTTAQADTGLQNRPSQPEAMRQRSLFPKKNRPPKRGPVASGRLPPVARRRRGRIIIARRGRVIIHRRRRRRCHIHGRRRWRGRSHDRAADNAAEHRGAKHGTRARAVIPVCQGRTGAGGQQEATQT